MTVQAGASVPWLRVSVVIPALNEARNLPHVFARLPLDVHEVIVVDGLSVDDTIAVARQLRPDVRIVLQSRRGKGNALACGFAAATGDIIAMIDADGSADPGEIPRFVQALVDGAEFAKGTRFTQGGGSDDITRLRALGNRVLVGFVNLCHGSHYTDLCYGYNAFWRRLVPLLGLDADSPAPPNGGRLWGDGFEVETLIHLRVAAAGPGGRRGPQLRALTDPRCEQPQCGPRWPAGTADHPGRAAPLPLEAARWARYGRPVRGGGCGSGRGRAGAVVAGCRAFRRPLGPGSGYPGG